MTGEERGGCVERGGAGETNGDTTEEAPVDPGRGEEATKSDPGGVCDQEWRIPRALSCQHRQSIHASGNIWVYSIYVQYFHHSGNPDTTV